MLPFNIPLPLLTDSYKTSHFQLYPDARKMVAYGEFRTSFEQCKDDERMIFYGMRYLMEHYIAVPWTLDQVEKADLFFKTHNAGFTPFPFPKDLFLKFIKANNGYFPVKIEALAEGTVIYPHVPVYQITASDEYAHLVTYLETILTMTWYPSTVATLSKRCRTIIEAAYEQTVDEDSLWTLDSRLHDFGFRGCTSVEQSIIGGCAHLLNFDGTDTLSAAYYAQFNLNGGKPVATSIPATEHSVMTAFPSEKEAIIRLLNNYGHGVCACVMDSYDYVNALDKVLPSIAKHKLEKGGFLVLRPDSGDPVEVVMQGLRAIEKVFGATTNSKGYKVVTGASIIQGDAVTYDSLQTILKATTAAGFAAQNVGFGMGGGLLQKVNRDTMSFATKLSQIVYADGTERDVMKMPKTGMGKISLPGTFAVVKDEVGIPIVYPAETKPSTRNLLRTIYDHGPITTPASSNPSTSLSSYDDFATVRARVKREWAALPRTTDKIISPALHDKITAFKKQRELADLNGFHGSGKANANVNGSVVPNGVGPAAH
ncbi:nicotinate phosphoribosyltransferase [Powellomyces hirtus]|uniref:Nicotinamide phosphoribosyltransferase n=1 Tax=Powellomyces hirtus TaxID=109895 RepID=A0A507DSW2_9FUNG|nr:nicotinate phosphoribosyltransferase [Powellomyces hirtus]